MIMIIHNIRTYFNLDARNYSVEFYIKGYSTYQAPHDKVKATVSLEEVQDYGSDHTVEDTYIEASGEKLYFDITIDTNGQDLSENSNPYTLGLILQQHVTGGNLGPGTIRVRPSIKFSEAKKRNR